MYKTVVATFSLLNCFSVAIIPQELPTLLSIVYSNIPPVKLGADSKLGFGFRLGQHADFQTLIELGPQEKTKPVGLDGNTLKRQSSKRIVPINNETVKKGATVNVLEEPTNDSLKNQIPRTLNRTATKKTSRPSYIGKIEFKKVPGIDDVSPNTNMKTRKKISYSKPPKIGKFSTDAAPTRFVIL